MIYGLRWVPLVEETWGSHFGTVEVLKSLGFAKFPGDPEINNSIATNAQPT